MPCLGTDVFASGSRDKTIKIWSAFNEQCIQTLLGHTGCVLDLQLTLNNQLISCSFDKTIRIWDLTTFVCKRVLNEHSEYVSCIRLTANQVNLVSLSFDERIFVWNMETGECVKRLQIDSNVNGFEFFTLIE